MQKKPVVLIILDGFGHSEDHQYNAISIANTPNWDNLKLNYPHGLINASEEYVGLPNGQMGNSEVGHLSIGSGRVLYQDIARINKSIDDKSFFQNKKINHNLDLLKKSNKSLHLFGLISDGGVHSHIEHFDAFLKLAKAKKINKVYIHAFLDGRDTPPRSAKKYITFLEELCRKNQVGNIVTICGRFYAMDRDNRWDRTEAAYNLVTQNQAQYSANSAIEALENGYKREENDEFISPTTINIGEEIKINNADTIVFLNFRSDRARQFTNSILDENFNKFKRSYIAKDINYFTLTEHDSSQKKAIPIFETIEINNSLGEIVAKSGKTQLRIAETEKYPHVTFFFNGGEETIYPGEDRILIPSPKVETYDLKPEMSAYELTEKLNEALQSEKYDLIVCNYANGDMVGHTGNINAVIKSIEVLDKCLGKVLETVKSLDVKLLITADHGNAELMLDEKNNQPHTQHTINPVPFLYVGSKVTIRDGGNLSDIAPTILTLMNEKIPEEMTGKNLIIN